MMKTFVTSLLITFSSQLMASAKMPSHYQISYGDVESPIQITEYFSLSCPQCIKTFRKDFPTLKRKYLREGKVYFQFHIGSSDVLTLQALACLEKLGPVEKTLFFEALLENMHHPDQGAYLMQKIMVSFGHSIPLLDEAAFLERTDAFKAAQAYIKEPDRVREFPTVEINGILYDEMPTFRFIEEKINEALDSKASRSKASRSNASQNNPTNPQELS